MGKRKRKNNINSQRILNSLLILLILTLIVYINDNYFQKEENVSKNEIEATVYAKIDEIPEYTNEIYVILNDNKPYFTQEDYNKEAFENYSELDSLGRCGVAYANICKDIMPPAGSQRGDISSVRPSGWRQTKYNGEFLYNRCHLIAYSLANEDANKLNLITGTRYFNVQGMLPFEMQVLEYIRKNEENHVLYRVTPIFKENNLLASGVEMEAYSIEDNGEGICFNVYVYNVEPGANIDYATGKLLN